QSLSQTDTPGKDKSSLETSFFDRTPPFYKFKTHYSKPLSVEEFFKCQAPDLLHYFGPIKPSEESIIMSASSFTSAQCPSPTDSSLPPSIQRPTISIVQQDQEMEEGELVEEEIAVPKYVPPSILPTLVPPRVVKFELPPLSAATKGKAPATTPTGELE